MTNRNEILCIVLSEEGMRARKVVTRSRARPTGKYPSLKSGRMMQWESPHEHCAFQLLDADPSVLSFSEQPALITYKMDGVIHRHYPDLLVKYRHGTELWEVKPWCDALTPEIQARTRLMTQLLPKYGYTYRVMTENELDRNPMLATAQKLIKFGRRPVPLIEWERVRQVFLKHSIINFGDIESGALGRNGMRYVCRLILEGKLTVDWTLPFGHQTSITINNINVGKSGE